MPKLLRTLFTRADPVTNVIVEQAKAGSAAQVAASNRLQDTIAELLDRNDNLTFRRRHVQKSGS